MRFHMDFREIDLVGEAASLLLVEVSSIIDFVRYLLDKYVKPHLVIRTLVPDLKALDTLVVEQWVLELSVAII
jgi:hypothetical protein